MLVYKCNYKNNYKCTKKYCGYLNERNECYYTSQWKYAKKTPLNYIKKFINYFKIDKKL